MATVSNQEEVQMNPVELFKSINVQKKLSGEPLLHAFNTQPRVSPFRLPPGGDDSDQIGQIVHSLTATERRELGLEGPRSLALPTRLAQQAAPAAHPTYQVRVQAILCVNDDGSSAATSNAVDANYVKQLFDILNPVYHAAGVHFVYNPATDFARRNSSLLNQDMTLPPGLNLNVPASQSPLDGIDTFEGGQNNWRWCKKCQGLCYAGFGHGFCPAVYFTEFCQAFHAKAAAWFTRKLPPWDRVRRGWSERSDACPKFLVLVLLGLGSGCQFVRAFAHGVSFQGDFIGVMDQAI